MKAKPNNLGRLLLPNISLLTINDILGVESLHRLTGRIMFALTLLLVISGNFRAATRNVPAVYVTIQAAINAASSGDTINVSAGTYTENVNVTKALTIIGAGSGVTTIVATDGNSYPLNFSTTGATVSGFTLTHHYTPAELSAWTFNNNGVSFTSGSGNTLSNCIITLNRNGIYINNSQNNVISNNTITNNRTGINTTGNINGTHITGNLISNNWTEGLVSYYLSNTANYSTVTVTGNTFDNNWYTEIEIKDASANSGILDVSANTFADNPVTYSTSSIASLNEPAFAAQIPNVPGISGTATKPVTDLPTLRIYNSGSVVLKYNNSKTILVEPGESIQAAINAANPGDAINVYPGTFSENLTIAKKITLQSVSGAASTTISGSNASGAAVLINHDSVSVNGFTITNPSGKFGISATDHSSITISSNIINNIGTTDVSSSGTNIGISVISSASPVDLIAIVDNTITNVAGGNFRSGEGITIGFSTGNFNITNLVIQDNIISSITSSILPFASGGRGAYGILLNHGAGITGQTVNAIVQDNNISNLEGSWAHGIGLEGNTPNILVQENNINNLTGHQTPTNAVAVQVESNASASTVNIHLNNFSNVNVGVANIVPGTLVNAKNNWWGSATGPTSAANPGGTGILVSDSVLFDPWTGKGLPNAVITWPTGNVVEYTTNPSLSWYLAGTPADSSYTVLVRKSTNAVYSGSFPDYFALTGITSLSVNVPAGNTLTPGAKYFYKIRAYFPGGIYTESSEESFTIDSSLGRAPVAIPSWPINNETVYSPTPVLNWYLNNWTAGTLSYKVIITDSADHSVITNGPINSASTSLTLPVALKGGHTYNWRVETLNGSLSSGYTSAATFTVDASQGGAPAAIPGWPVDNTTVYSSTPRLTWYLSSYATGTISYRIIITDTLDHSIVNGSAITASNSFLDLATNLQPGHTYNWRVETINGSESSGYSDAATFTVDISQGSAPLPILNWPIGNATVYTTVPSFSWYLSYGTVGTLNYYMIITDSANHNVVSGSAIASSSSNFTLDSSLALTPGHTYNWRIITINGSQNSGYSNAGTFTVFGGTAASTPTPAVSWPTGGNTVYADTVRFSWYLNDAAPSGSYSYTVEIKSQSIDFDGVAPVTNTSDNTVVSGITGNSFTLTSPLLTSGTAYHWRVKLVSGASSSAWSDENISAGAQFSTSANAQSITLPVIGAPDHSVLLSTSTSLSWHITTKPSSKQTYHVELSRSKDLSNPFVQYTNLDSFTKAVGNLGTGVYYWRVRASSDNGKYSNYSKIATFTIKNVTATENSKNLPKAFAVSQNYPNPFNPSTVINYALPKSSLVSIKIYNILGQEVKTLINSEHQAGNYSIQWNGDNNFGNPVSSGAYIYRVTAGQNTKTMKMVLLK
jgi:parallel beta-helix repeat protein